MYTCMLQGIPCKVDGSKGCIIGLLNGCGCGGCRCGGVVVVDQGTEGEY